jgi:1,4-alpha-glucan branching enzyme
LLGEEDHMPMVRFLSLFILLLFLSGCAARSLGPQVQNGQVRFTLHAPSAASVVITGSFIRWDRRGRALSGPDRNGVWSITMPLPPGRHEYAYIINGTARLPDPGAPTFDDRFAGRNTVVEVP